jgi:hypothetical protein
MDQVKTSKTDLAATDVTARPRGNRSSRGLQLALLAGTAVGMVVCLGSRPARAFNLYTGTYRDQTLTINLETEIEYSTIYRVNDPSAVLAGPLNANGNDGDADFRHGFVDNSFTVTPVFDVKYGNYGVHVSGDAYLDTPYLQKSQNNQAATYNPFTTASNRDFTSATRNINGQNAQLLDAFAYGTEEFGANDEQSIEVKFGRQTLLWGQSFFFPTTGISGGQAPINIITAQSLPNPQAQELFQPVGQGVVTYQPNEVLTFQGYYQFEWEPDTFQGVGAYFSSADFFDKGGQRIILGPGVYAYRGKDLRPGHNGQFGASVQATLGNYDLGFYYERFDAKAPEVYLGLPSSGQPAGSAGTYYLVYPRDISLYGASISTTIGPANVAAEISGRTNQPLASGIGLLYNPLTFAPVQGNANSHPLYAVGDTIDAQSSVFYISPGFFGDPGGATVIGEIQGNKLVSVTANKSALSPGRNPTAVAFDVEVEPTYYNVLPNLEVQFPISVDYTLLGRSQIAVNVNHGTGTIDVGVQGTYQTTWIATLSYQDYLGSANASLNGNADRGYVSFNIQHTF